jgi:hypothetical protein
MPLDGHSVPHSKEWVKQGAPAGRQEENRGDDDEENAEQIADFLQPKLKLWGLINGMNCTFPFIPIFFWVCYKMNRIGNLQRANVDVTVQSSEEAWMNNSLDVWQLQPSGKTIIIIIKIVQM